MGVMRADEAFRIEVVEPSRRNRVARVAATLTLGLLTLGAGPVNVGGRRLVLVDQATGERLVEWPEQFGDDMQLLWSRLDVDLATLSADEFAARWIEGMNPSA